MDTKMQKLEDLGYGPFFESSRIQLGLDGFQVARVISEFKGAYKVKNANGEFLAKITGKQIFNASSREDFPAVGDWVAISVLEQKKAIIHSILPRKSLIKRKYSDKDESQVIAANIDVAFVVESVDRDYNLNRLERYFAIASEGGIKTAIILNKTDLVSKNELDLRLAGIKVRFKDIDILATSVPANQGVEELEKYLEKAKTYCFLGSSGVGKSSLINMLIGNSNIGTHEIGARSGRGKHTTTSREMYFLDNGTIVIDNPGMREVGMTESSSEMEKLFDEIALLAKECKFADCAHIQEPSCKVLSALESGALDKEKYSNYIRLKKETQHYEMTRQEKKQKDRNFGKFLKKAKRDWKKYSHKDYGL